MSIRPTLPSLILAGLLATQPAAAATLLAIGSLTGSSAGANADLSGLTGTLENGVAANVLGGIGSGLAWAGGNDFIAVPDRGPNATPYNAAVDDTVSYISRLQSVSMALTPATAGALPMTLTPTLTATTLLSSSTALSYGATAGLPAGNAVNTTPGVNYFTGRSDNFAPGNSGNAGNARLDPEGVRVAPDGKSVFVSDEYGPYVYQFDRTTGQRLRSYTLPANLDVASANAVGATEISGNTAGRTANKGMEGLAITPDGKTLVGIMQAALIQDNAQGGAGKNVLRIVTIDVASGATHEYAYNLTTGSGVSEIVALNDHEFLVDERDGKGLGDGSAAAAKTLFKIDLAGATDVSGMTGKQAAAVAVPKTQFLDLVGLLNANGIASTAIPAKIEGLAIGADVTLGGVTQHTLWVANDNDFVPDSAGPNQFYVIGFTQADLGTTLLTGESFAQQSVPEPASWAMLGAGLAGLAGRRNKN